jgi:Spy/CpxP family protein refolding chaperone
MILLTVVAVGAATISVQAAAPPDHGMMMRMHGMHAMGMKVQAGDVPGGMHMDMMEHVATLLKLNDDQKASFKQLHEDFQAKVEPLFEQHRKLSDQLQEALAADNPDPKTVGTLVIQAQQVQQQIKAAHDDLESKVGAILTPEQKIRLEVLHDLHEGGPEGGLPPFGHPGM